MGEATPGFEAFYENTHSRLYTALCLVTGSRHEAEDVMQEAFVRVWERWDKVGRLEAPTGYLYRALGPADFGLYSTTGAIGFT